MAKKRPVRAAESTPPPENTKEHLVQAAKHLFAQKGFDGTTVKDISDRAGVNVSLVSYHFSGKEGLYRACLQEFGQGRLEAAQRMLQLPTSLEEFKVRLGMFVDEMVTWLMSNPECCQMIQREADSGLPIAEDVFANTFLQVFATIKKFLAASQEKGFLRKDFDAHIAAGVFHLSLVQMVRMDQIGARFFDVTVKDEKYLKKLKDQFISIFMHGLANESRSARGD
jgi:AcrR family transcriptional regulator